MRRISLLALPLASLALLLSGCGEEAEKKRMEAIREMVSSEVNTQLSQRLSMEVNAAVAAGIQNYIAQEKARQAEAARLKAEALKAAQPVAPVNTKKTTPQAKTR